MKLVTVTTVRDEGAAQVAKEALTDRGIAVELRRQTFHNPYFASATASAFEVRVPEDKVRAAEAVLAHLSVELEQALMAQAGAAADEADQSAPIETPRRFGVAQAGWWFLGLVFAGVFFIAFYAWWEGR